MPSHKGLRLLVLLFLVLAYATNIWQNYQLDGLFSNFAADYRGWWSAGSLAARGDLDLVYNLPVLARQQELLDSYSLHPKTYEVLPVAYQPFYLQFLCFLAWLPPIPGWLLWTLGHWLILGAYLAFTLKRRCRLEQPLWWWAAGMLSMAAFLNLFYSQIADVLVIAVGEFFHHQGRARNHWWAGFWLSLWAVKTQYLVLIVPCVVFSGRWRIVAGFLLASAAQFVVGWGQVGLEALQQYLYLLSHYKQSYGAWPMGMVNWRMTGLVTGIPAITWIGSGLTFALTLSLWRNPLTPPARLALATGSATMLFSWHAHPHTTCILIPLLWGAMEVGLPAWACWLWCVGPGCWLGFCALVSPLIFSLATQNAIWGWFSPIQAWFFFGFQLALLIHCWHANRNDPKTQGLPGHP